MWWWYLRFYSSPGLQHFTRYKEGSECSHAAAYTLELMVLRPLELWKFTHQQQQTLSCTPAVEKVSKAEQKCADSITSIWSFAKRRLTRRLSECKWKLALAGTCNTRQHSWLQLLRNFLDFFLFPIHYLSQQSKCKNLALWIMRNVCVIPWRTSHLWSNEKITLWQINWSTVTASDVILLQHFSDYLKVWPPLDSVLFATWESPRRKMNELNKDLFSHRKALVGLMNHFLTCLTFHSYP